MNTNKTIKNRNNNNNNKKTRPRRNRQRKPRTTVATRQNQIIQDFNHTVIPRALGGNTPFPAQMARHMRYLDPIFILKNAAAAFLVREFKVNDLFDPDPLLGGGSVSGYTTLATIYSRNIVTDVAFNVRLVNIEPGVVAGAYVIFRDAQPSLTITSFNSAVSSAEVAPASRPVLLGPSGGQPKGSIVRKKISMSSVLGRPLEYLTDIGYAANINASPPNLIWGALVVFSYTPLTLFPNGITASIEIDYTTKWFSGQRVLDSTDPLFNAREKYYQKMIDEYEKEIEIEK